MATNTLVKVEYFLGDCMKVIGTMCENLSDYNQLQNAEILALVEAELDAIDLPECRPGNKRPKPSRAFMKNYHSGNDLVLSSVKREKTASATIEVIVEMCKQMAEFDGLNKRQCLALIKSYLVEHIIEFDFDSADE